MCTFFSTSNGCHSCGSRNPVSDHILDTRFRGYDKAWQIFLFCAFFLIAITTNVAANLPSGKVCFSDRCVIVEVAQKPQELMRGLQFRRELPVMTGMLFIMPANAYHSFWMKDTFIPLDMVWISEARTIVAISCEVPPCDKGNACPPYSPQALSRYVLELNAGEAARLGLQIGDVVTFDFSDEVSADRERP